MPQRDLSCLDALFGRAFWEGLQESLTLRLYVCKVRRGPLQGCRDNKPDVGASGLSDRRSENEHKAFNLHVEEFSTSSQRDRSNRVTVFFQKLHQIPRFHPDCGCIVVGM